MANDIVLVLINPHSGRGKSLSIYKKKLLPFLKLHDIDHQAFITRSDLRVHDYIKSLSSSKLNSFKYLLIVSGDGLLHETVNALLARDDWEKAINVPIGIVPTGSGNGLAYTLIKSKHPELNNMDDAISVCMEQAVKNKTCQTDLVKITYGKNSTVWSFLSIGWGLLADIDIDSEWLRSLGEYRFTIYGLLSSVTSTSYRGRLSCKQIVPDTTLHDISQSYGSNLTLESNSTGRMYDNEAQANDSKSNIDAGQPTGDDGWIHIEDKFACIYAVHQSYISREAKFAPKSTLTDQVIYLTYVRGKLTTFRVIEFLSSIKDGSHVRLPYVKTIPVSQFKFQPLEPSRIVVDGEVIPWTVQDGPICAEVVPKVMRLLWDE